MSKRPMKTSAAQIKALSAKMEKERQDNWESTIRIILPRYSTSKRRVIKSTRYL